MYYVCLEINNEEDKMFAFGINRALFFHFSYVQFTVYWLIFIFFSLI